MAVTISKNKKKVQKKPKAKASATPIYIEEAIDQIGELQAKLEPLEDQIQPITAEIAKLKKTVLEYTDEAYPPEEKTTLYGDEYSVEWSAKGNATDITDMEAVQEILESVEEGLFLILAKVGITDLKKYMTPKQLEKCTETVRRNARRLKLLKKAG